MNIGTYVQARDHSRMLELCDTYHSQIAYGEVVGIYPEYAASMVIRWFGNDGVGQNITYLIEPRELVSIDDPESAFWVGFYAEAAK
jgi:hypothetical protein